MPKVRQTTGNYPEVLGKIFPQHVIDAMTSDCTNYIDQLLKDLRRDQYLPSNDRTYEEYLAAWLVPTNSTAYAQGSATASIFKLILQQYILTNPRFLEKKAPQGLPDRNEEYGQYLTTCKQLSLAYFDDEGVLCGVSIDYSSIDPNLWTAAIMRNTAAAPEDREVLVISSEELFDLKKQGLVSATNAQKTFLDYLHSKTLMKILGNDLFEANGAINFSKINALESRYDMNHSRPYSTTKVDLLEKRVMEMANWELTEQKLTLVKDALTKKRNENIVKLDEWYADWHEISKKSRLASIVPPSLEVIDQRSFLRRNSGSIFAALAATVTLIGFALVLSGVLAPFGIALIGATELILGALGAGFALIAMLASATKIGLNERHESVCKATNEQRLSAHQAELASIEPALEKTYANKLTEINALMDIEQLPENEALQIADIQKQLVRAVVHADFSEEEFNELNKQMMQGVQPPVTEQVNDVDEMLMEDQSLVVDESFTRQMHVVEEIASEDEALNRAVDKVIQQEEHAQEIVAQEEEQQSSTLETNVPPTLEQADSSTHNNIISVH